MNFFEDEQVVEANIPTEIEIFQARRVSCRSLIKQSKSRQYSEKLELMSVSTELDGFSAVFGIVLTICAV